MSAAVSWPRPIRYGVATHTLHALGSAAVPLDDGHLHLEILVDRTSIETYANGGRLTMTNTFLPTGRGAPLGLYARGGEAKVVSMSLFPLESAWPRTIGVGQTDAGRR